MSVGDASSRDGVIPRTSSTWRLVKLSYALEQGAEEEEQAGAEEDEEGTPEQRARNAYDNLASVWYEEEHYVVMEQEHDGPKLCGHRPLPRLTPPRGV